VLISAGSLISDEERPSSAATSLSSSAGTVRLPMSDGFDE
jgi:hypothetical protein